MLKGPIVWLGQSADTSSICSDHTELRAAPFLTSLGCAIRRPSLLQTHFHGQLKSKLGLVGPLMVDSGGFALTRKSTTNWTVRKVANCITKIQAEIFVSLDLPPALKDSKQTRHRKIAASARNYFRLTELVPDKIIMPVVHGRTLEEIELSIRLLTVAGSQMPWIGLGGVVPLLQRRRTTKEIVKSGAEVFIAHSIAMIRQAFPHSTLHVFGAGGTRTFPAVCALGAESADSIGWRQAAGFGSIFLPLTSQRAVKWKKRPPRKTLNDADLEQLRVCGCPICSRRPSVEGRLSALTNGFYNRSIHNAWTVVNQAEFWPASRTELVSRVAAGLLGPEGAKAVASVS